MKIYFDESGQTGCVLQKKDLLTFQTQPTFALGAVVVKDDQDAEKLIAKYNEFLNFYHIDGEIKGSKLLTKAMNGELKYFMRNILDRTHFYVILYDKRFYISTLLLMSLVGLEYKQAMPEHFYRQAGMLSLQDDEFFIAYLKYIQSPGVSEFKDYLHFLIHYNYSNWDGSENAVITTAKILLKKKLADMFYDDFMTFGWYDNPQITNLINLNALSELIFFIKSQNSISNDDVVYVHDHIHEFEDTFQCELANYGINMTFVDSKKDSLLQIADNVVSIARHAYDKAIGHIRTKKQFMTESEWDMQLMAQVMRKISIQHINFTVPPTDWAAALCIETMFNPRFPREHRNNFQFNYHHTEALRTVYTSVSLENRSLDGILRILEE